MYETKLQIPTNFLETLHICVEYSGKTFINWNCVYFFLKIISARHGLTSNT